MNTYLYKIEIPAETQDEADIKVGALLVLGENVAVKQLHSIAEVIEREPGIVDKIVKNMNNIMRITGTLRKKK